MSFKGFTKAVTRAPQNFRQKFNMGQQTQDPVYQDAERRFKELEEETKKLSEESKRYFTAVNGMLKHQIGFSKAIEEIFKPISGKMSDPNAAIPEDNPDGIEASEQYRAIVAELQTTLKPDLELIEEKIVKPAQELLKIIDHIRKMATKRNHKQLDLDRHMNTYNKYETKKEPTPKDEERLYKAQAQLEVAQQEYDYYNDMLKNELPLLFQMEADFVKPLFVSFYYMQLNIFYTLYNRMQDMKIPYFDLNSDIIEAFQAKRGNIEEQTDALTITHFKIGYSKAKLEMTRRRYGATSPVGSSTPTSPVSGTPSYGQAAAIPAYGQASTTPAYGQLGSASAVASPAPAYGQPQAQYGQPQAQYGQPQAQYGQPQAQYGQPQAHDAQSAYSQPPAYSSSDASAFGGSTYTPPTTGLQPGVETVTALYDYQAQAEGDLTFPVGAIIEVVERTTDTNGWWTGRYNGQQGVFPGNYVQINKQ